MIGRRWLAGMLACAVVLTGCAGGPAGPGEGAADAASPDGKLKVAATLFPYYDFVRQIAGDRVDLELVVPAGMDSHSFEPTPAHMRTIEEADVLIINGGEMETWVSRVLEAVDVSDTIVAAMMDYVDAVEEETVPGMEDSRGHGGEAHSDVEYDEHIWTSPANAIRIVEAIADVLSLADPEGAAFYGERAEAYRKELAALDEEFSRVCSQGLHREIIVADRFPFRYLAEEYGLEYRAAFSGCSTDTEPSAKTIALLIDEVRKEGIPAVYYLELSSPRAAEIIGEETGAEPLLLHSCHNVTREQFENGVTYLDLMRQNVENLRKGLGS